MPFIPQNNTISYIIHYGINDCNNSLYTIEKLNIFNLTINICYNFSDNLNYSSMFIECLTKNDIEYNKNKDSYDINRIIFTFSLLIIMLLIILILYFVIRIYFDKLDNNYKELELISELKKYKQKENNIENNIENNTEYNTEYNTFDNL